MLTSISDTDNIKIIDTCRYCYRYIGRPLLYITNNDFFYLHDFRLSEKCVFLVSATDEIICFMTTSFLTKVIAEITLFVNTNEFTVDPMQ